MIRAVFMSEIEYGLTLNPIHKNNHTWIIHGIAAGTLGQDMPKFRHHHVDSMSLNQLGGMVLPRSPAFRT